MTIPIPSVTSLLKQYGLRAKKGLGQHFLSAMPTVDKIVKTLNLDAKEDVLEIGPGLGVLSAKIASHVHAIFAIETDIRACEIIKTEFSHIKNLHLIHKDILKLKLKDELIDLRYPVKVVGNIPYNITSPILFWLVENKNMISSAFLMTQKELADRIVAPPNSKTYGALSIMIQARACVKKIFNVSAASFIPPPKVSSSVIKIDFQNPPDLGIKDWKVFEKVVRTAFQKRRKTIKNALSDITLPSHYASIEDVLNKCKIKIQRRPETLSLQEFADLANMLV